MYSSHSSGLTLNIVCKRRGSWLHKGLIVKIMAKELKQAGLLKCKGVIRKLPKPGVAEIAVIDPEAVVQVGQIGKKGH